MVIETQLPKIETTHLAGIPLRIENHVRQRCLWCGIVLVNVDLESRDITPEELSNIAPQDPFVGVLVFRPTSVVLLDGNGLAMMWHVNEDGTLPGNCCAATVNMLTVGGSGGV